MAPMLARMAAPFGVTVRSAGGFDGVTSKYALAENIVREWTANARGTVALHVGDHDPSGVHIFRNLEKDASAFIAGLNGGKAESAHFERIAVTPEQIINLNLPAAPAKITDHRAFTGVDGDPTATVQAEAIDPATLAGIVEAAIRRYWNEAAAEAVRQRQEADRLALRAWLEDKPG